MFNLFKSRLFHDPVLGELKHSRGLWRGALKVAETPVPLALCGNRHEPDPQAVTLARGVPSAFISWRGSIEDALFEHYAAYAAVVDAEESQLRGEPLPIIRMPSQVWPHVSFEFVSITLLAGALATELGLTAAWDEEHTLGARFQAGEFVELNGSVLPP